MSKSYQRYEILLPIKFNDGRPVPSDLISATLKDLRAQFDAISVESQTIHGTGSYLASQYDDLVRVFVDVADEGESRTFFTQFKERLKQRFEQWDIWITTYPVDVI